MTDASRENRLSSIERVGKDQFSVYDWQIQEILRSDEENTISQNIITLDEPVIRATDTVDALFKLLEPVNLELERFSGPREIILAIGEQEVQVSAADNQITFENIEHLAELDVEDFLTIRLFHNNDSENTLWEFAFEYERLMLADFNRDGIIKFDTKLTDSDGNRTDVVTEEKPFVFWVNDDDDDETTEVGGHDITATNFLGFGKHPDYENLIIDGSRDLIDFISVGVDLHSFINKTPDAIDYTYTLKQADSAVNIVYTEMGFDNSDQYLKELNMADIAPVFGGWQNATTLQQIPVHNVTSGGIELPNEFITFIKENDKKGIFLAEINAATTEPLELLVTDNEGKEVLSAKMYLRTVKVEELYLQASLRDINSDENASLWGGSPPNVAAPIQQWNTDKTTLEEKVSDLVDTNRHVIHVHGFNNTIDDARAFQSETYKRLYHSGSNVLFTGIHWRGDEGLAAGLNYWANVENAFNSADDLAAFVNLINGSKIIAGHSLGNVVVGSAIENFLMDVDHYFMINPAVAIEAYDATQLSEENMRHPSWDEFYFGSDYGDENPTYSSQEGRRLWSSDWFNLFADTTDPRSNLTWRGRFASVISNTSVVQFYSTGEEVLKPATEGEPNNLEPILDYLPFVDVPIGSNAWNIQEKTKGTNMFAAVLAGNSSAGWGFNETCDVNNDCANNSTLSHTEAQVFFNKTEAELIETSFFDPFDNEGIHDPLLGSGNAQISHPHVLAYEIPALSFAAGGASVGRIQENNKFDMNAIRNGWPLEREEYGDDSGWWHSDFKSVAYLYTHKLFDQMVFKGQMQ